MTSCTPSPNELMAAHPSHPPSVHIVATPVGQRRRRSEIRLSVSDLMQVTSLDKDNSGDFSCKNAKVGCGALERRLVGRENRCVVSGVKRDGNRALKEDFRKVETMSSHTIRKEFSDSRLHVPNVTTVSNAHQSAQSLTSNPGLHTRLLQLATQRRWDLLRSFLSTMEGRSIAKQYGHLTDSHGRTALHVVCCCRLRQMNKVCEGEKMKSESVVSPSIVTAPLGVVQALVEACPVAVALVDSVGRTPLHLAALSAAFAAKLPSNSSTDVSEPWEILRFLLRRYKESASLQDNSGKTPLMLICENLKQELFPEKQDSSGKASFETKEKAVSAGEATAETAEETADESDGSDDAAASCSDRSEVASSTSCCSCDSSDCLSFGRDETKEDDTREIHLNAAFAAVKELCRVSPESLPLEDVNGVSALEHAIMSNTDLSIVKYLMDSTRDAARKAHKNALKKQDTSVWRKSMRKLDSSSGCDIRRNVGSVSPNTLARRSAYQKESRHHTVRGTWGGVDKCESSYELCKLLIVDPSYSNSSRPPSPLRADKLLNAKEIPPVKLSSQGGKGKTFRREKSSLRPAAKMA